MTESDLSHYNAEFESNKSSFEREVLSPACKDVNSDIISKNYKSDIEDLQIKTNELKTHSSNFTKSFSPVLQMKNVSLTNRRLQIAIRIRNICNLYESFDDLYKIKSSDRSILDIMKLVQLYTKLNSIIPQYCQIQVCYKIKEDIDQKILNIREIIIETIHNRGFDNLTSFELFQLIIISSSFHHFWNLFDFNDSLFTTKNYTVLLENIQKIFLFFGKFEKLSSLLTKSNLNEYLAGIQKKEEHFITIIFTNIRGLCKISNRITDFESFSDYIFNNLDLLKTIEHNENISSQFRSRLNGELSEVAFFIYRTFSMMEKNQFPNLISNSQNLFLDFITKLNFSLKLYINPSQYDRLKNNNEISGIIKLYREFISMRSAQGFTSFPGLLDEVICLTNAARTSNEGFIPSFQMAFYNIALREFNSVIASLLRILDMKESKEFEKSDDFKGRFEIICKKVDRSVNMKEIMDNNIVPKLKEAIEIKNTAKEFYGKQKYYVDAIVETFYSQPEPSNAETPKPFKILKNIFG